MVAKDDIVVVSNCKDTSLNKSVGKVIATRNDGLALVQFPFNFLQLDVRCLTKVV